MRKFLMKMKQAGLVKCFMNWAMFVDEIKRERILLARFAARWKNMCVYKVFAAWQKHFFDLKHQRELELAGKREDPKPIIQAAEADKDFLRGKNFLRHTNAFKSGDLNPLRVKELLAEVKALKEENRHLRETIVNLKIRNTARLRSPSPPRGNWQKGIHGIIASQKFAQSFAMGGHSSPPSSPAF